MSLKTFVWKFKDLNKLDSKRTFLKIYFLNNDPAYCTVYCTYSYVCSTWTPHSEEFMCEFLSVAE